MEDRKIIPIDAKRQRRAPKPEKTYPSPDTVRKLITGRDSSTSAETATANEPLSFNPDGPYSDELRERAAAIKTDPNQLIAAFVARDLQLHELEQEGWHTYSTRKPIPEAFIEAWNFFEVSIIPFNPIAGDEA